MVCVVHDMTTAIKSYRMITRWKHYVNIKIQDVSWFKKTHGLESSKFIEYYYIESESFYLVRLHKIINKCQWLSKSRLLLVVMPSLQDT